MTQDKSSDSTAPEGRRGKGKGKERSVLYMSKDIWTNFRDIHILEVCCHKAEGAEEMQIAIIRSHRHLIFYDFSVLIQCGMLWPWIKEADFFFHADLCCLKKKERIFWSIHAIQYWYYIKAHKFKNLTMSWSFHPLQYFFNPLPWWFTDLI